MRMELRERCLVRIYHASRSGKPRFEAKIAASDSPRAQCNGTKPTMNALFTTLLLVGCKPTPEAPKTLDELASYFFEHFLDEDVADIEAGLANLDAWLTDNAEMAYEGYRINDLKQEIVEGLDIEYIEEGVAGAAVGYEIAYPVDDVVAVMMLGRADPDDEPSGEVYSREYIEGDRNCMVTEACDLLDYTTHAVDFFPMGLEIESRSHTQHRRITTEAGDAFLQRSWMTEPASANYEWLQLDQQFWISTLTPWKKNKSRRMEAGWVVLRLSDMPIPEEMALDITINELRANGEYYEDYIAEKGVPEPE